LGGGCKSREVDESVSSEDGVIVRNDDDVNSCKGGGGITKRGE
jgi:hypothetical protein